MAAEVDTLSSLATIAFQPTAAMPALHQYACLRCRSRRVKCDKRLSGCANCAGHAAQCVYSARRPRKTHTLQQHYTGPQRSLLPSTTHRHPSYETPATVMSTSTAIFSNPNSPEAPYPEAESEDEEHDALPRELRDNTVPNARDRITSPCTLISASNDGNDLSSYHPPVETMQVLWDYYRHHVDVMVKILYKPSVNAIVTRALGRIGSIDATTELPLLFAIWLASVTSMSVEECRKLHGDDKKGLTRKYRYALEQALLRTGWMSSQSILILQSIALYLVFASENSRSTWMLSGIALSLAQALGLHSEASYVAIDAAETEVRRRVWWTLCQLDVRVSENCALQPHVPLTIDTRLPMNINDSDLASAIDKPLDPRDDFTEVSLTLGKIEMAKTILEFKRSSLPREERENIVHDQLHRYENVYLKYYNRNDHLHRFYYYGTRLIMTRLWKMMYDADPRPEKDSEDALIYYNADVLEIAHQLPCKYRKHGWYFRCKYTQWHAVVYLLGQMCKKTQGHAVERAWEVIDAAFADWKNRGLLQFPDLQTSTKPLVDSKELSKRASTLWSSLLRLHERAREAREQACKSQRQLSTSASTPSALSAGTEYKTNTMTTPEDLQQSLPLEPGLMGDPFLGSTEDLDVEMNWEQLDDWVKSFQEELRETDTIFQDNDMGEVPNWW